MRAPLGEFPAPQYARRLGFSAGGAGAVLLGDAAHSFPPDLGQGVNSALEDAAALARAIDTHAGIEQGLSASVGLRLD